MSNLLCILQDAHMRVLQKMWHNSLHLLHSLWRFAQQVQVLGCKNPFAFHATCCVLSPDAAKTSGILLSGEYS
jgi:hypothetical protein